MKAPSPAFSLYPKDILTDENVSAMTDEELGVYFRLLCHAWLEGSVPADLERMARMLRRPLRTIKRLWPAVAPCWKEADGRLTQLKLEAVRAKQVAYSDAQSRKGKKGGKPSTVNTEAKPVLNRGKAGDKPDQSIPFPSSIPSPRSTDREEGPPIEATPAEAYAKAVAVLGPATGSPERQADAEALIRDVAKAADLDPTEVLNKASQWKGHGYVRVSTMSPARLDQTILALRTWLRSLRGEPEPGPPSRAAPSPKAAARSENFQAAMLGGLKGDGTVEVAHDGRGVVERVGRVDRSLPAAGRGERTDGAPGEPVPEAP